MHVTAQPTPCRYLSEFARLSGACCTIQDFSDKHQHIVVLTPTWLLHLDTRWLALEFCNRLLGASHSSPVRVRGVIRFTNPRRTPVLNLPGLRECLPWIPILHGVSSVDWQPRTPGGSWPRPGCS